MALIDDVFALCGRLADAGWAELLAAHGLDIRRPTPAALAAELARDLPAVRRAVSGFEDFAHEGRRGIEPGFPARSLLYHALASPNVLTGATGQQLDLFPTLRELEVVENYVFGVHPPRVADLLARVGAAAAAEGLPASAVRGFTQLAVVVFAGEYRPASQTCQKVHADMVFARTGVARVGTAGPNYDHARRGFLPESGTDPFAFHVLPARYAAYLAVRLPGNEKAFRPMRYQKQAAPDDGSDTDRAFWVPVHKLFDGKECLAGHTLTVRYTTEHVNEKIGRVRVATGDDPAVRDEPPFRIRAGIAEVSADPDHGAGLVIPVPHPRLVEPAVLADGTPATFVVKANRGFFAAYQPRDPTGTGARPAPEYAHARTRVDDQGGEHDLNDLPDVEAQVNAGGYRARHYLDFTGDGWVAATVGGLAAEAGVAAAGHPAYSLVTAPDFFPTCDQRELTEWAHSTAVPQPPTRLFEVVPDTLCDQRYAANVQLPGHPFDPAEGTVTALVPLLGQASGARTEPPPADALRHSHLPDDAAGVFAPGWDVSHDTAGDGTEHLAAYGLGSPFPEDSKLCAALSTFWPGVAPDSTQAMEPRSDNNRQRTVAPLTEEEIGQTGTLPWDGVPGPRLLTAAGQEVAEYASFPHVDYVRTALDGRFTLWLTARVTPLEYETRVLGMALVNRALGPTRAEWNRWVVAALRPVAAGDPEVVQARTNTGVTLAGPTVYRFTLYRRRPSQPSAADFRMRWVVVTDKRFFLVDPANRLVLGRRADAPAWRRESVTL